MKYLIIVIVIVLMPISAFSQEYSSKTIFEIPSMFIDPLIKNMEKLEIEELDNINSEDLDYAPVISADGKRLYFVSDRDGSMNGSHDVWIAERDYNGNFKEPVNMNEYFEGKDESINTRLDEGTVSLSVDENDIYYSLCSNDCKIFNRFKYNGEFWYERVVAQEDLWISQPSISPNNKKLFFITLDRSTDILRRKNRIENADIYFSEFINEIGWTDAFKIESISTRSQEAAPYMASDGITLFFSSAGFDDNEGGLDYYVTRFDSKSGLWTKPINLRSLNTDDNDMFISIPARGGEIFFSQGDSEFIIYQAKLENDPYRKYFESNYCKLQKSYINDNAIIEVDKEKLFRNIETIDSLKDLSLKIIDARGNYVNDCVEINEDGNISFKWNTKYKNSIPVLDGVYFYKLSDKEGNIIELGEIFLRRD